MEVPRSLWMQVTPLHSIASPSRQLLALARTVDQPSLNASSALLLPPPSRWTASIGSAGYPASTLFQTWKTTSRAKGFGKRKSSKRLSHALSASSIWLPVSYSLSQNIQRSHPSGLPGDAILDLEGPA